jgi:transposase-like protein
MAGIHYDASHLFYMLSNCLADSNIFKYIKEIRRLIYSTNTVEGYHSQIRMVIRRTRCVFF